jgi:hypothetical protein
VSSNQQVADDRVDGAIEDETETAIDAEAESDREAESLSRDDVFEMLSNRRRRYAIHHLKRAEGRVSLSELAEQVAAWENETTIKGISSDERKTVYTSLQQFHLPKMEETGVVRYDDRAGTVELTDSAATLDIYLEVVDRYDVPWSQYYLGVSLIGATVVGLSTIGIYPFSAVPYAGWTVFLLASFMVSALAHYVLSRRMRLGEHERPPEVRRSA